jgi:F-type H+-transporting ATPase subunit b
MESLIHAFGLDVKVVVVQIVNFAILAGALGALLYKPLLKVLREREETIAQGLHDADAAAARKAAVDVECATLLASAQTEARAAVARGKTVADEKAAEIIASADEKAVERVRAAETQGEAIIARAVSESEAEIAKLAVIEIEKKLIG